MITVPAFNIWNWNKFTTKSVHSLFGLCTLARLVFVRFIIHTTEMYFEWKCILKVWNKYLEVKSKLNMFWIGIETCTYCFELFYGTCI